MKANISVKNNMSKKHQQVLRKEITKSTHEYIHKLDSAVLYLLYEEYGFGKKRLRQFYDRFHNVLDGVAERYEYDVSEAPDICELKLKDIGVNLREWEAEKE